MTARTKEQQEAVERCQALGRVHERAAESVLSMDAEPRLALLCDAATCFIAALMVGVDASANVEALEAPMAWTKLDEMVERGAIPELPSRVSGARVWLLASARPLGSPRGAAAAAHAVTDAFAAVRWLRRRVEPRTPGWVRRWRAGRKVALTVAAGFAVVTGLAVLLRPTNIALGKTVTGSSLPDGSNRRPGGLTNGLREASCGAETKAGPSSWFVVDLETPTPINRVVVSNRGDGNPDDSLPLELDVGDSLTTLESVATRTEHFTSTRPWVADNLHRTARYVRVRRTIPGSLALDEIEVYR